MTVRLLRGEVRSFARHYHGAPFHALLCDPPYELGFMGRRWDRSGIAFDPSTWVAFLPLLHPGAFGMAFASSRGWHRLACAIEDAGYIIHPSIFGWVFGSGFPKATRVNHGAEHFDGHRYGLQAIKPALEPIIVFQKPYEGKPVECITATGAGALNIDGARLLTHGSKWERSRGGIFSGSDGLHGQVNRTENEFGRWPANFYTDEAMAKRLDSVSQSSGHGHFPRHPKSTNNGIYGHFRAAECDEREMSDNGDLSVSRFFFRVSNALDEADPVLYCPKASRAERDAGLETMPLIATSRYQEMATQGPRPQNTPRKPTAQHNVHPTVKPLALCKWLAALLLPPAQYAPRRLFVPFAGVASECIGAAMAGWEEIVGVEREAEYIEIGRARARHWTNQAQPALLP